MSPPAADRLAGVAAASPEVARLRALRSDLIDPTIAVHPGACCGVEIQTRDG